MKPFLLLATRAEDLPADEEYELFLRYGGLREQDLIRWRLESAALPRLMLDDFSGIFLGGSPFNASDPPERKSATQRRVEADLTRLLDHVIARDHPFLGACYGIGAVGGHQGAAIDTTYAEPIGVVEIQRTRAGASDPLLRDLPDTFTAFVGHKEAVSALPPSATLLATSASCPVQMFRVGSNVYATQFHPELDLAGITTRIHAYAHHGYFGAGELEATLSAAGRLPVTRTGSILRAFVDRYRR